MTKQKSTLLLLCSLITLTVPSAFAQQKPQYTQYMFNGLIINPAVAGSDNAPSLTFLNRNQWTSIEGAPVTQTLSGHTPFGASRLGGGLSIVNDKIGVHRHQNIQGSFSYRLKISQQAFLSMGLQGGISIRKSNYSSISGPTADPRAQDISHTSPTLGMGFFLRTPKLDLGISAPEVLPEKFSANDTLTITWQQAQYFLYAKYLITLRHNLALEPSLLVKYKKDLPISYDLNLCLVIKKALTTGLSYRDKESIGFLLKAKLTPKLQFGYAYDYPIGEVATSSSGSHELMVNYVFKHSTSKVAAPR